jgi:hypothetical protein
VTRTALPVQADRALSRPQYRSVVPAIPKYHAENGTDGRYAVAKQAAVKNALQRAAFRTSERKKGGLGREEIVEGALQRTHFS